MADHRYGTPRDVSDQAPFEVIDRIEDTLLAGPAVAAVVAEQHAEQTAKKAVRRNWRWTHLAAAAVAVAVSFATSSITYYTSQAAAQQAQTDADRAVQLGQSAQKTVADALTELDAANKQLQERGQAPVQVASNPDPSDAIQAAVLAKVLAQLPATPTAEQIAAVLQPAVAAQVAGPTRDQLADLVSSYFVNNPTAPQIQAAVDAFLTQHPPERGPEGKQGVPGANGADGAQGMPGADSTVPGPEGSVGPPGPACPDGSHIETVQYGLDVTKTGPACVFD